MTHKVYIKGTLIIDVDSTVFKYRDLCCMYDGQIPDGAEIIDGEQVTINDLNNNSSFFKSYYIKGGVTTLKVGEMHNYRSLKDVYDDAYEGLVNISRLISENFFSEELLPIFYRQVYIGTVGIFEAYLSDMMICWVFSNEERFSKYVETEKKESISLDKIRFVAAHIEDFVHAHIQNRLYHRLDDVKDLYKRNMGIDFPERSKMMDFIVKRHDLVHRNGKDKDGRYVNVTQEDVFSLIQEAELFIKKLYEIVGLKLK